MHKHGKKYTAARAQVAADRQYSIEEAMPLAQKVKFAKFDETVELTLRLGVDPKHADQMVRGTVVLPHGLGKSSASRSPAARSRRKPWRPVLTWLAARRWSRRSRPASWTSTPLSPRPT